MASSSFPQESVLPSPPSARALSIVQPSSQPASPPFESNRQLEVAWNKIYRLYKHFTDIYEKILNPEDLHEVIHRDILTEFTQSPFVYLDLHVVPLVTPTMTQATFNRTMLEAVKPYDVTMVGLKIFFVHSFNIDELREVVDFDSSEYGLVSGVELLDITADLAGLGLPVFPGELNPNAARKVHSWLPKLKPPGSCVYTPQPMMERESEGQDNESVGIDVGGNDEDSEESDQGSNFTGEDDLEDCKYEKEDHDSEHVEEGNPNQDSEPAEEAQDSELVEEVQDSEPVKEAQDSELVEEAQDSEQVGKVAWLICFRGVGVQLHLISQHEDLTREQYLTYLAQVAQVEDTDISIVDQGR